MGRNKRKNHSKKRPQAKGKEAPIDTELQHQSKFRVAVSHALSSWVMQGISLCAPRQSAQKVMLGLPDKGILPNPPEYIRIPGDTKGKRYFWAA